MHDQPTNTTKTFAMPTRDTSSNRWPRLLYVDKIRSGTSWPSMNNEHRAGDFAGCEFSIEQCQSRDLPEILQRWIQQVDNSPISVHGVEYRMTSGDARKTEDELNEALRHIRSGKLRYLNLLTPPLSQSNSINSGPTGYQDLLNFAHTLLRAIRFEAEASGVAVSVVAGAHGCLHSPVELRELVDAIGSWSIGVCLDETQLQFGPTLEDWIATLGPRTKTLRLKSPRISSNHGVERENEVAHYGEIERLLENAHFEGAIVIRKK